VAHVSADFFSPLEPVFRDDQKGSKQNPEVSEAKAWDKNGSEGIPDCLMKDKLKGA